MVFFLKLIFMLWVWMIILWFFVRLGWWCLSIILEIDCCKEYGEKVIEDDDYEDGFYY